jgi:membrane protein DedA with SNARE-associated domain
MQSLITFIFEGITLAGGWGVFLASILEEIFSPIPSSLVQMGSGAILLFGQSFSLITVGKLLLEVSLPSALGVTIGSLPYVWLARKYGIRIIEKWGRWIGITMQDIHQLENKFSRTWWDDVVFVGLRAFPAVPSVALALYGGIMNMSWMRYVTLTATGVFIRATALGAMGWIFGKVLDDVSARVDHMELWGLGFMILLFIGWVGYKKMKK